MQISFLGPLRASEGERGVPLGGPKQRLVLAHLLIRANQVVPADRLVAEIWADNAPDAVRSSLHSYVSHLRKALGPDRIESHGQGYALRVEPDEVDGLRFEALAQVGHRLLAADHENAARVLGEALDLWQGPPFADLAGDLSLQAEVDRLEELRVSVLEDRIAAELAGGRDAQLVGELEALTAAHPLRERLWGHLMLALYRSGRQGESLEAYERARQMLADELGIDPSPDLKRLHEQVLRQDPELRPGGRALRGYRLLERIGAGSFGVVHRALQPHVGREVAVKAIHPHLSNHPEFIRGFEAEAQMVARIEHPHVVPLYDYWREPDGAYLVMRYLRGGSLRDLLDGAERLEPDRALRIIDDVAEALAAAHRQGVVHRDVKSSNVLLDDDDNAYLSDFGIAHGVNLVTPGTRGTRPYLSPERMRGEPATPPTDVYALGVLLSQLLPDAPAALRRVIERSTAADPRERYPDAAGFLAALRQARSPAATPAPAPAALALRNPYKGLRAFTEADASDFFGREALTARLVTRLREDGPASRFLAVVGPSGGGKSSVVRAGLIPALRAGALPGSASWFVVQMTPGAAPFDELEAALLRVAVDRPESVLDQLQSDDTGLLRVADRILPDGAGELLLVVDQFEEVFTLVTNDDRTRSFLDTLVTAVTDPRSRLRVVVTLRADFYDRPLRHRGLAELLRSRIETVTPLTPAEIERAVTGPAEHAGIRIDPGVVAQIITDVADQPGALPLLQYALTELFDRRRDSTLAPDAYREIGGVSGALARRAEAIHAALADEEKQAARQLFLRLVTVGEGADDVRRRVLRTELTSLQADPTDMETVIEALGRARLLSFDRDPETREPTVEVAHEALLREWGRLRGWIDAAREDLRVERRLAGAARDWDEAGRDASFLASGSRLDQFEAWRERSGLASTPLERAFLEASLAERDRIRAEDDARQARERALERRSFRRLRALVAVLAVAALVASALSVFAFGQRQRAAREARVAGARELAAAAVANVDVDPERSILLALEAVDRTRSVDGSVLPEAEEALHRAVIASRVVLTVPRQGGALEWSPDGTVFVTEGPEDTGIVDIREAETGASLRSWRGHDGDVTDVAFSSDTATLATTGDDGALRVWDPESGEELATFRGPDAVAEVWGPSFSADGELVAAAWPVEGLVRVGDVSTGEIVRELGPRPGPSGASFSPGGELLAMPLFGDQSVPVVDATSGVAAFTLEGHDRPVRDVAWSPDGRWIATAAEDLTARIWDAETGDLRYTLHGHSGDVRFTDWSPDSTRLVTGSADGTAKVWQITGTGAWDLMTLSGWGTQGGSGVAFSPNGERVMAGNAEIDAVQIWDIGLGGDAEWTNVPANLRGRSATAFTPGGDLIVGNDDGSVTIRDPETSRELSTTEGHGPPGDQFDAEIFTVAANPDGTAIAVARSGYPYATVWDAATGREVFTVDDREVYDVAWSPDGALLALSSGPNPGDEGGTTIVDRSGAEVAVLPDPGYPIIAARFSPDGRLLATARDWWNRIDIAALHVRIWDWERAETVATIETWAQSVAFSPDGTRIATGHPRGFAEIWDIRSGERLMTLAGHAGFIADLAYSPDGSRIATASSDSTIRLWDAETGIEILALRGHESVVSDVAFSPDGSKLASAGAGLVRVWALDLDDLIAIADTKVTRTLTDEECRQYLHVGRCPDT